MATLFDDTEKQMKSPNEAGFDIMQSPNPRQNQRQGF